MSGIHYTVPEALKQQMGKLFGAWSFKDIILSNPRRTDIIPNADMLIDAAYGGVSRTLAYKRPNIKDVIGTIPGAVKPLRLPEDWTIEILLEALHTRYGIRLTTEEVDPTLTVVANGAITIVLRDNSPFFIGSLRTIVAGDEVDIIERPQTSIHRWPLAGNTQPTVGDVALTGPFDYETINNVQYAGSNTNRSVPLGVSLRCVGEFTLRFKIYVKAVDATLVGLFNNESGDGQGTDVKLGTTSNGRRYVYVRGTLGYQNWDGASGVALPTGKEATVTLRGINTRTVEVYIDGILSMIVDSTIVANDAWTHFGKSNQPLGSNVRVRDIEYFDHAIDIPPTQAAYAVAAAATTWALQPWYEDNAQNDSRNVAMVKYNPALITYGHDYTKHAAFLKTIPAYNRPWNNANDLTNTTILNNLVTVLKDIDGAPWQQANALNRPLNLYRCAVVYNGPTAYCRDQVEGLFGYGGGGDRALPTWLRDIHRSPNLEYDRVLGIWLKTTWENNEGYGAVILIHYNED